MHKQIQLLEAVHRVLRSIDFKKILSAIKMNIILKRFNHILPFIALLFALQGCASFPKKYSNIQPLASENLSEINGQYKIKPIKGSIGDTTYLDLNNAFEKFFRGKGRGSRDTFIIGNINRYSFGLKVADENNMEITYFKDSIPFRKFYMQYKIKKDGFIHLKNKNVKVIGIPYLFGSIDIKKLRLGTINKNLLIDEVYHSSGAILLIFGDSKTWTHRYQYERIR